MKKYLLLFFAIVFSNHVFAADAADDLTALLTNIQTLQGNFTQTISGQSGVVSQQSSGKFALQRPGKFRWQVTKPGQQLLVADGSQIWFYDVDLDQVTVQAQTGMTMNSPAALLSGDTASLMKNFKVQHVNNDGFLLMPRNKDSLFHSVRMIFADRALQSMIITDNLGQLTQVNFSQLQTNSSLATTLFHFTPPSGVDVIKQS